MFFFYYLADFFLNMYFQSPPSYSIKIMFKNNLKSKNILPQHLIFKNTNSIFKSIQFLKL